MQALGTDPTLAGLCIVVVGSRQGKKSVTRVFIHAKRTSAQQYSAGRDNRLVGSFPGLFPKPPRLHVAGCFVWQPAYSTRPLLGFLCGSVRCHGKKPVGIKGPAAQPDLPERF